MGASTEDALGCSCEGGDDGQAAVGSIAASESYYLKRAGIGFTFNLLVSEDETYRANASLGYFLFEPSVSSKRYTLEHPFALDVVPEAPEVEEEEETDTGTEGEETTE